MPMVTPSRELRSVYEINTPVYLDKLSRVHNEPMTLATIPDEELERIASYGCDSIWLMGVWKRSLLAVELALHDQPLLEEVRRVLPDFQTDDMIGSAYAISAYEVNDAFGGEAALLALHNRLGEYGLKLILDFVPNHTAFDHTWVTSQSGNYIQGSARDITRHPSWYRQCDSRIVAHGRDPQFEPWPDVAQLNAFSGSYRDASIDTLHYISSLCDGVRCDMAMLMITDVFKRTWGKRAGTPPVSEYWQEIIASVHQQSEDFIFIAECYWDMQPILIEQGFDYCYDKDVYDSLVAGDVAEAQARVDATSTIAPHLMHFIENHDEPRAASLFDIASHSAAIDFIMSLHGPLLWHDGQFEGYRRKLPVHIGRGPDEPTDSVISEMYRHKLVK